MPVIKSNSGGRLSKMNKIEIFTASADRMTGQGMETSPPSKHLLYGVQVILLKEPVDNPWLDHRWRLVDMVLKDLNEGQGDAPLKNIAVLPLRENSGTEEGELFTAETAIDLHHAEAEAYAENLASSDPSIYVVLRSDEVEDEVSEAGIRLVEVSLSPYHIQDYEDCGEDQVEKLPLAGPISDLVTKFVETYYQPEVFRKRRRDRVDTDEVFAARGDPRINKPGDVFRTPAGKTKAT